MKNLETLTMWGRLRGGGTEGGGAPEFPSLWGVPRGGGLGCGRWTPGAGKPGTPPQQGGGPRAPLSAVKGGRLETAWGSTQKGALQRAQVGRETPQ